jgi:hypothetical protein
MPSSNLIWRGGGLASVAAGLLLLLGHLFDLGGNSEYGTVLGGSLILTAHVVLVFGLVALYAAQVEQSGLLGALGMVLGMVALRSSLGSCWSRSPGPPERRWRTCSERASRGHSLC